MWFLLLALSEFMDSENLPPLSALENFPTVAVCKEQELLWRQWKEWNSEASLFWEWDTKQRLLATMRECDDTSKLWGLLCSIHCEWGEGSIKRKREKLSLLRRFMGDKAFWNGQLPMLSPNQKPPAPPPHSFTFLTKEG